MKNLIKIIKIILNEFKGLINAHDYIHEVLEISPPTILENILGIGGFLGYIINRIYYKSVIVFCITLICMTISVVSLTYRNLYKEIIPNIRKLGIKKIISKEVFTKYKYNYIQSRHISTYLLFKTSKTALAVCVSCISGVAAIDAVSQQVLKLSIVDELSKAYRNEQTFSDACERVYNYKKYQHETVPILKQNLLIKDQIILEKDNNILEKNKTLLEKDKIIAAQEAEIRQLRNNSFSQQIYNLFVRKK